MYRRSTEIFGSYPSCDSVYVSRFANGETLQGEGNGHFVQGNNGMHRFVLKHENILTDLYVLYNNARTAVIIILLQQLLHCAVVPRVLFNLRDVLDGCVDVV